MHACSFAAPTSVGAASRLTPSLRGGCSGLPGGSHCPTVQAQGGTGQHPPSPSHPQHPCPAIAAPLLQPRVPVVSQGWFSAGSTPAYGMGSREHGRQQCLYGVRSSPVLSLGWASQGRGDIGPSLQPCTPGQHLSPSPV